MNIESTYKLNNGIKIPKLGYGTFQTPDDELGVQAIIKALQIGYRHIDTAQSYRNEESVGKAIKLAGIQREELFITTKVANSVGNFESTIQSLDDSLDKLELDYIDLVLIHWPSPKAFRENWQQRNHDVWKALESYYQQGKIKAIGISNFKTKHINELLKTATITPAINQIRLCPGCIDTETIDICQQYNILLEAYSPLAQGLIFEVQEISELAEKYNKNVAQIALRWSLQMGFLPLPKSITESRTLANTEIFDFELEETDVAMLTNLTGRCGSAKDPDSVPF
ncbi:aldo/keto reductase [Psychromonas sp. KJ10-10]|uniref:aldo/keto reductase n=1 Tax=Psychromonas sp. KJ10-10 TaxID=3391823 RepID=UPI0039B58840